MYSSRFNLIASDFKAGNNFKIGGFCHIYPNVRVGHGVSIRSYVELREGTVIGDDCYIDSGVKSSGNCIIGNKVIIRYDSIIARGVTIDDNTFISPQLMTENLNTKREEIGGAKIGKNVFIGTDVTLASGIKICDDVIIGTKSNVRKSITRVGVYIGNPAKRYDQK
jgi:UDP-2-acetamido-3-amino-2,3-dideoxy-glucuronate N-acetyltransferase